MSGGVIKKYETKTLVKVKIEEGSFWYSCQVPVFVGDKAQIEMDGELREGEVVDVKTQVTSYASPVPFSSLKEVSAVLENE
jgi:hypothetical protein